MSARPSLALRPWGSGPGDAVALAAAWVDPDIAAWTAVPEARDVDAAAAWIAGRAAREAGGRVLDLVVHDPAAPDDVLGEVGLVLVDEERRLIEVGWWVAARARGRGIGAAAVALALEVAAAPPLAGVTAIARIHPANEASVVVAARAGFARVGALADGRDLWRAPLLGSGRP